MSDSVVAVDAMGGDHAPAAVVAGAVQAARRRGLKVVLTGPADLLRTELETAGGTGLGIGIVDAPQSVGMDESPLTAHRRKPDSSVRVAAALVARGDAQALFSAGHTGATFLAARAAFGLARGVERPALAVSVPTRAGAAILLDAGANLECEPEHLCQFAVMGAAYARLALGIEHPKVGLLSIGEEAGKGNDLIRGAHALLERAPIEFLGNLEAREFFSGRADVIVCDGFTGNISLKVGEGLVELAQEILREETGTELVSQIVGLLTRRAFARFRARFDYAERGGAPLLGLDRLAVVGHGRSSAQAVESGLATAAKLADTRVLERMNSALAAGHLLK